jgi:transcriptional regulator GlxA family with amidase domain
MAKAARRCWFAVCPSFELLDLSGPWSVLGHANEVLGREAYALELVSPLGGDVPSRQGLALSRARHLARHAGQVGVPDTLLVAGGAPFAELPRSEERLVRWLREHHRGIRRLVSICTGAFLLAEAGLLDGRRATTHWRYAGDLRRRFPEARVIDEDIFTTDGRVWTSAGITAGIDLTLALVEADHGHAVAMAVAKELLLFLRRSGGQAQFSEALKRQEREPPRLRDLSAFVLEHLDEALPVERLAARLGMSPRTLARWCGEQLHESPAALVRRLRLDEARRLLERTSLPLKDIATRTGIGDTTTLWRVFTQHLGVTPATYRERFADAPPEGASPSGRSMEPARSPRMRSS